MNFYEYLGVKQTASTEEIRHAFRKIAKVTHPDYNKKNSAFWEMVELNLIRDTLLHPEKRAQYDHSLKTGTPNTQPTHHTQKTQPEYRNIYKTVRSFFIYHCKVCGHEMSSTWQGYCLYHYLEYTGQLNNEDYIFEYAGQRFQWADPPEHMPHSSHKGKTASVPPVSPLQIILFASLIIAIISYLFLLIKSGIF